MDAFVFPGQGSQRLGMGGTLFDEVSEFKEGEDEINDILGYSIRTLCLEDPDRQLNNTAFTQPALYVVNALHYYSARSKGLRPSMVAGHSLGEYNALHSAGVIDFVTGLRIVQKRGKLMSQARNGGGMAAVIGMDVDRIAQIIQDHDLTAIDIANFNSPAQTVISGPTDDIRHASTIFEEAGVGAFVPLAVSAAFHSRYMEPAAIEFDHFLSAFTFRKPEIPVISNVTARPYKTDDSTEETRELLVKQISSSVQWTQTVYYMLGCGVTTFHEMGPGDVLTRLIQKIRQ